MNKDWSSGIVTVKVEERSPFVSGELEGRRFVYSADGTKVPGLGGIGMESVPLDPKRLEEILSAGRTLEENGVAIDSIVGVGPYGVEATVDGRKIIFAEEVRLHRPTHYQNLCSITHKYRVLICGSPERIVVEGRADGKASGSG